MNDTTLIRGYAREQLFSIPQLKKRGWTDTAVKRFLPQPDDTRPNPYYSNAGGPMKMFLIPRVEQIEATVDFQDWLSASARRKDAAWDGVLTKEAKLSGFVANLVIEVPQLSAEELLSRAVEHYNELWSGSGKRAYTSDAPEFLERIQVNYLRHSLTRYEQHLDEVAGKTGAPSARTALREKIYFAIGDVYPQFIDECGRQADIRRGGRLSA
jgi:hypothetical protein